MASDLGDPVLLEYQHRTPQGNRVDAESMSLIVGRPDGTLETLTPTTPASPGWYSYAYLPAQAGRHTVRWVGTGANPGAHADVFDVRPGTPAYLVSLADVKKHLNYDGGDDDQELRETVESATAPVEDVIGPVVARTCTDLRDGGPVLMLGRVPVLTLMAVEPVSPSGLSYDPGDLDMNPATGAVRRLTGGSFAGPLRVTYTAGRRVVDAAITNAAKIIIAHAWETQRGHSTARPGFGDDELMPTPSGFLIPRRAMEMLHAFQLGPLVA